MRSAALFPAVQVSQTAVLVGPVDCLDYSAGSVQLEGAFSGTIKVQGTNDPTFSTWEDVVVTSSTNTGTATDSTSITAAGLFSFGCPFAFMQVICTTYTSGSPSVFVALSQGAPQVRSLRVAATPTSTAVAGTAAHSAAASGNPVLTGGKVITTAETTLVAGDVSDLILATSGALITEGHSVPDLTFQVAAASGGVASSAVDQAIAASAGAGLRNYLDSIEVAHDTLGAVTEMVVKDGSTVIWRTKLQTTAKEADCYHFDPPLRGSAATALSWALGTSVTGAVYVNAQGHRGS